MNTALQMVVVAIITASFTALLTFFLSILSQRRYFRDAIDISLKTHANIHHKKSYEDLEKYVNTKVREEREDIEKLTKKLENIDRTLVWLAYKSGAKPEDLNINI